MWNLKNKWFDSVDKVMMYDYNMFDDFIKYVFSFGWIKSFFDIFFDLFIDDLY